MHLSSELHKQRYCVDSIAILSNPQPAEEREEMDLDADLLLNPFSRQAFQGKLDIVKKDQATLKLADLSQPEKEFIWHFHSMSGTACLQAVRNTAKLYCFQCLLFATDQHGV